MYCSKCGAENTEGSQFCNKCGASIGQSTPQTNNDALKVQINEAKSSEKTGWILTAVGIVIMLIGFLVGAGSTATRYIGNFQYETYHPNAAIGVTIAICGGVIGFIGAIAASFYMNKWLQLNKKLK